MDLIEEGISIINRKKKLKKDFIKTIVLTYICYFGSEIIYYNGCINVFPMIEVVMYLFRFDKNFIDSIILLMHIFFWSLPVVSCVVGINKIKKIIEDVNELKKEADAYNTKVEFEEQKPLISDLKVRFESLPRGKQIEILNYIKSDIKLENNQMYIDINSLGNTSVDYLQREFEDILFPGLVDDITSRGEDYTRKRTIDGEMIK